MLVTGTHGGADSAPRRKKLPETVLGLELEDRGESRCCRPPWELQPPESMFPAVFLV